MKTRMFVCAAATMLFLMPLVALSQSEKAATAKPSPAEAEALGKYIFDDEIKAGKLTATQAGQFYLCANEDYSNHLTPEMTEAIAALLAGMEDDAKFPAGKKKFLQVCPKINALMDQSEERCASKLGFRPPKGKALARSECDK